MIDRRRRVVAGKPAQESVTLSIDAIAAGGEGIGRLHGMAVFVPRSAPGDVITATVVAHRRFARGRIEALVSPSSARVRPLCRHYDGDSCGGCQLQHVNQIAQRDAKVQIVRDSMLRIGKRPVAMPPIEASPAQWDYRQKLTLTLVRDGVTDSWTGGLHRYDRPTQIFALEECRISSPSLVSAWHQVRAIAHLLPIGDSLRVTFRESAARPASDSGVQRACAHDVQHGDESGSARSARIGNGTGVALAVYGGSAWPDRDDFVQRLPSLSALWWTAQDGERAEILSPDKSSENTAANFVQANAALAPALHDYVLQQVKAFDPRTVLDAYAGTGALSVELAQSGVDVTAVEWDGSAVQIMRERLPPACTVLQSAVEGVIQRALYQPTVPDVVVLNPPRIGAHQDVTSALDAAVDTGVRAIVYVSCDPATLARDVARMPGWRIQSLHCFDMFPQTAHVETVCVLTPESS